MKKIKANAKKAADNQGSMPLTGHLRELRNRIVVCIIFLIAGILICLNFAPQIVTLLTDMGKSYDYHFVYVRPQELLLVYFSISIIGGIVIAIPVIAYEVYAFCSPALERRGRATFVSAMLFGAVCFCLGVAFAYFIILPFMLRFLVQFSVGMDITNMISIGEYVSFLLTIFVIFGIIFEMPVVSVLLTRIGILRAELMMKSRKVMIVIIFFVAAIITPPDIVSQIMVAIPMIGLFELSILLSKAVRRRKTAITDAEEEEE